MEKLLLVLGGMGCGGCVKNVQKALDALPGVTVENISVGTAVLAYEPSRSTKEVVVEALGKAGYPAQEVGAAVANGAGIPQNGGHCGV